MDREKFATEVLSLKARSQWDMVLAGKRNLGTKRAVIAGLVLKTDSMVWMDKGKRKERIAAWKQFNSEAEA